MLSDCHINYAHDASSSHFSRSAGSAAAVDILYRSYSARFTKCGASAKICAAQHSSKSASTKSPLRRRRRRRHRSRQQTLAYTPEHTGVHTPNIIIIVSSARTHTTPRAGGRISDAKVIHYTLRCCCVYSTTTHRATQPGSFDCVRLRVM